MPLPNFATNGAIWSNEECAALANWLQEKPQCARFAQLITDRAPWTDPVLIFSRFLSSDLPALVEDYKPVQGAANPDHFLDHVHQALNEYLPLFPPPVRNIFNRNGASWDDEDIPVFQNWLDDKWPEISVELTLIAEQSFPECKPRTVTHKGKTVVGEGVVTAMDLIGDFYLNRFDDTLKGHLDVRFFVYERVAQIPRKGRALLIIASVNDSLHFRIFRGNGQEAKEIKQDETELADEREGLEALKQLLADTTGMWNKLELTADRQREVAEKTTTLVGYALGYTPGRCTGDVNGFWGWFKRGFRQFCLGQRRKFLGGEGGMESLDDGDDPKNPKDPQAPAPSPWEFMDGVLKGEASATGDKQQAKNLPDEPFSGGGVQPSSESRALEKKARQKEEEPTLDECLAKLGPSDGQAVRRILEDIRKNDVNLSECLNRLIPRTRVTVILADDMEWDHERIRKKLFPDDGRTAVRVCLFRARKKMKKCLSSQGLPVPRRDINEEMSKLSGDAQ